MDFKQLRSFVAVADCGSFTQAAAKLYASQPTVSAHIRQLEEELHETLFLRTTKSLAITPARPRALRLRRARARFAGAADARVGAGRAHHPSRRVDDSLELYSARGFACVSRAAPGSRVFDFAKRQRRRFAAASRGPLCTRLHRREGGGAGRSVFPVFYRPYGAHHAEYSALPAAFEGKNACSGALAQEPLLLRETAAAARNARTRFWRKPG